MSSPDDSLPDARLDITRLRPALDGLAELLEVDGELLEYLYAVSHLAVLEVPHCVGVSVTLIDNHGAPYTATATADELRPLDAAQYLDGGPCVSTALDGAAVDLPDVLDEQRWHLFASTTAAAGIRSSLSLPLLYNGRTIGSINLYGETPDAFEDRKHLLAELISGHASMAISNADLSLQVPKRWSRPLDQAAAGPLLEKAIQVLMQLRGLDEDEALESLQAIAGRAGVDVSSLAEVLLAGEDH